MRPTDKEIAESYGYRPNIIAELVHKGNLSWLDGRRNGVEFYPNQNEVIALRIFFSLRSSGFQSKRADEFAHQALKSAESGEDKMRLTIGPGVDLLFCLRELSLRDTKEEN